MVVYLLILASVFGLITLHWLYIKNKEKQNSLEDKLFVCYMDDLRRPERFK